MSTTTMTAEKTNNNEHIDDSDYSLTIGDVARILEVTDRTIRRYVQRGKLHPKKTTWTENGIQLTFSKNEVEQYQQKKVSGQRPEVSATPGDSDHGQMSDETLPATTEAIKTMTLFVQRLQGEKDQLQDRVIELSEEKGKYEERAKRVPTLETELKEVRSELSNIQKELLSTKEEAALKNEFEAKIKELQNKKTSLWKRIFGTTMWILVIITALGLVSYAALVTQ